MKNSNHIPLLWIILSLLAGSETLLPDPLIDDSSLSASSSTSLEGATAEARAAGCHFPGKWTGNWFQSGVHHAITVSRSTISTKGRCLEKDGEKYLVYNERDSCYRCLVFSEKHLNVLQYKETFCIPDRRSLRNVCSTITGDAYLFAMFRLDAVPIDCPFKGHFTISYNQGHGECRYPVSTLDPCTKSSRLAFNYQACPDVHGTESSVQELECLGNWKEGSSKYFLGLVQYQHHASYEERFRCFVYERKRGEVFGHLGNPSHNSHSSSKFHSHGRGHFQNNTSSPSSSSLLQSESQIFRVAQSGDATCNGLSSMEGSKVMTLNRVQIPNTCHFPSWIQTHSQWHTLDQGSTYTFQGGNLRISNFSELAGTGPNSLAMNAICYQVLENQTVKDGTLVVLHATSECKSGYLCSSLYLRDSNIIEVQFGSIARRAEDACQLSHFDPSVQPYVTLVSSTPQRMKCPNQGHFQVAGISWNGMTTTGACDDLEGDEDNDRRAEHGVNSVGVGCSGVDSVNIRVQSHTKFCNRMAYSADYNCYGWWIESGTTYVITSRSSSQQSSRPQRHCFAFRDLSWTRDQESLPFYSKSSRLKSPEDSSETRRATDDYDDDGQQDPDAIRSSRHRSSNNNNNNGNLLEFSSFADSCRRNVVLGHEGDFAFNLTKMGQCSDINSATGQLPSGYWNKYLLFTTTTAAILRLFANL